MEEKTINIQETNVDFVLIFGLKHELDAFLKLLSSYELYETDIIFYRARINTHNSSSKQNIVALALPDMGNYEAATATTRAIDVWKPRYVLLGGIAGGIKRPGLELGDLLVATAIVGYEPGKLYEDGLVRRLKSKSTDNELLETARRLASSNWMSEYDIKRPNHCTKHANTHFGIVVSGEKVIANSQWIEGLIKEVKEEYSIDASDYAAVEMEGYGTALACYRAESQPGMLLAKSICDMADKEKNDDWQEYAASVSAKFIYSLIQATKPNLNPSLVVPIRKDYQPYSSRSKINLCRKMGGDWEELADFFDIPSYERRRFRNGRECQEIWEWLENRTRLDGLSNALIGIGREDLVEWLIPLST